MSYLLRIDVSPRGAASHSRRFGDEVVPHLLARNGIDSVIHRDLGVAPLAPIDEVYFDAMHRYTSREESAGVAALAGSEQLIDELDGASALLIATPVYNYTVPAALKNWLDYVVRIGRTFNSTPAGKIGALRDRPAVVVSASGGSFSTQPATQPDFFAPYLDVVLATVGIRSVHHIRLEALAHGEDAVSDAYARARLALAAL